MKFTPKCFKKKVPEMISGEVFFIHMVTDKAKVRMFVRDDQDDSDFPSRFMVEMSVSEAVSLFDAMQRNVPFLISKESH